MAFILKIEYNRITNTEENKKKFGVCCMYCTRLHAYEYNIFICCISLIIVLYSYIIKIIKSGMYHFGSNQRLNFFDMF